MPSLNEINSLGRLARASTPAPGQAREALDVSLPPGIVQFASESLALGLFPRQGTLLKVATLDVENLTTYDHEVIAELMSGFVLDSDSSQYRGREGTTPDLMERMSWCREQGLMWFRDIEWVMGRRSSKNFTGSILVGWQVANLLAMGDPQSYFQIPPDKPIQVLIVGPDLDAVRRNAFGDIVNMFRHAPFFQPYLGASTTTSLSILTPEQLSSGKRRGVDQGSIQVIAAPTTTTSGRGPAVVGLVFDEFAHVQGAGSTANSIEVYASMAPAVAQFRQHGMILQISTPWEKTGQLRASYLDALSVRADGSATNPKSLMVQLRSTALYEDWERAGRIAMWPGGRCYPAGLEPKITQEYVDEQYRLDRENADTEFGAQFRSHRNPYLTSTSIDGVFGPYKGAVLEQQTEGSLGAWYVAHGDPSSSNANFGFAIGHTEDDDRGYPHVVFDLLTAWIPSEFPDHRIDYLDVNSQIYEYLRRFVLRELTFDQYSSIEPIQTLQARARADRLWWQPRIYERTATAAHNLSAAEIFKTAVNAGLVHAPPHQLARAELEMLTRQGDRIVAPTTGPTQTKDLADAMINVAYTLLHDRTEEMFAALSGLPLKASLPGGIPSFSPTARKTDPILELREFGRLVSTMSRRNQNPARSGHRR